MSVAATSNPSPRRLLGAVMLLCALLLAEQALFAGGSASDRALLDYASTSRRIVGRSSFGRVSRTYVRAWVRLAYDATNPLRLTPPELARVREAVPRLHALMMRILWDGHRLMDAMRHDQRKRLWALAKNRLARATTYRASWPWLQSELADAFPGQERGTVEERPPDWTPVREKAYVQARWLHVLDERNDAFAIDIFIESRHKMLIAALMVDQREHRLDEDDVIAQVPLAYDLVASMQRLDRWWNDLGQLIMQTAPEAPQILALKDVPYAKDISYLELAQALGSSSPWTSPSR